MPLFDLATFFKLLNTAGIDFDEGTLIIGKTRIPLPRWIFEDLSTDRARAEEILRNCFVQRRAMYTELDRQTYEYVLKSLNEISEIVDANRNDIPIKGSELDKELRMILGHWLDRTVEVSKAMRDLGADQVMSDPDALHACARLLAEYRRDVFPYVRVFMAVLGDEHPYSLKAREKLDMALDQMPEALGLSRMDVEEGIEPKVEVAGG